VDTGEAVREVVSVLRENEGVIAGLMRLAAIAVELHLVQPGVATWRTDSQGGLDGNDARTGTSTGWI
jgi:hypothetical protein